MAFPQDLLTVQTRLLLGGVWTDISDDVYARDDGAVTISRGRPDEAQIVDPGSCTFQLNNRSGNYSPRNPTGAHFGLLGRNTPIQVSVLTGTVYADLPGAVGDFVGTPDASALHIAGDIDVRVDATLPEWSIPGSTMLLGKYTAAGTSRAWLLGLQDGLLYFEWSEDGADISGGHAFSAVSTAAPTIPPGGRLAVRVTLDVNNGASGATTTFYTAPALAGPWTQLGAPVVHGATTSIHVETSALRVGDAAQGLTGWAPAEGHVYGLQVLNGIGGTVVANPDFTAQAAGSSSFTDAAGRTWTVAGNTTVTNRNIRFSGEVPSWPPRWDTSGRDIYVPITAAGIRRRLGQGAPPLQSTLRRSIPSDPTLLAYWPLEDDAGSVQAASAVSGGRPLAPSGVTFAADATLPGSAALPTLATGGRLTAAVPLGGDGTAWHVELVAKIPALPATLTPLLQIAVAGAIPFSGAPVATVQVLVSTTTVRLLLADADGGTIVSSDDTTPADIAALTSGWCRIAISANLVGGWAVMWQASGGTAGGLININLFDIAGSVTQVTTGTIPSTFGGLALGHLAVFTSQLTGWADDVYAGADVAYNGETAGARLVRLAAEENIPLELTGAVAQDQPMGYQTVATLLDTMQACADTDGGVLYEPRDVLGLAYRDRVSLYNQTPTVIGFSQLVPPLDPEDDDQRTVNDVTVQRAGGISARAVLTSGALSTQTPPAGVGIYPATPTLSLFTDDQAPQIAGWLLHLGTVDENRYPVITVYLQRNTELLAAVSALDVGSRIQVSNPPLDKLPPGAIDQLVEGYTETLAQHRWEFALNCAPASPWTVGYLDDLVYGRADTDGSSLATGATSTATSLSVATVAGASLWTTSASDTPFNVLVGGERMTVTNVTGSSSPQTFTVVRSVNGVVKAQTSFTDVRLAEPTIIAL